MGNIHASVGLRDNLNLELLHSPSRR